MSAPRAMTLADGQLAATAGTILDASLFDDQKVSITLFNTGSGSETVALYVARASGTSRQLVQVILAAKESCIVNGLPVQGGDTVAGSASDATTVNYLVVGGAMGPFSIVSLDANGAVKSGAAAIGSGNLTITGDLTVQGGDIDAGASGAAGTVDIFPSTASKGKTQLTATANTGDTTTTLTNAAQGGARTYTIPDAGASANLEMLVGTVSGLGAATSLNRLLIKKTGIADNSATDVITVTVPNANHAAAIRLTILSSNGDTDAFESSRVAVGTVVLARTTGANVVAAVSSLTLAQIATVSGGATHTLAYGVSSITGAVGATNTFTITVTIDDSGNLGSNQVVVLAELINAEASGVTMAAAA